MQSFIMQFNSIELTGELHLNPIHWNSKNKQNQESLLVHLILKEDPEEEMFSNIPVYIFQEDIKDFITKNTALNREDVTIKGELGLIESFGANKFLYSSPAYIALTKKEHGIFPLRDKSPNVSFWI
jgi:hypothetical protein